MYNYNNFKLKFVEVRLLSFSTGKSTKVNSPRKTNSEILDQVTVYTGDFLSQQLNAVFVAPKLQLQNRTCKPLCDFGAILAICRRGMRYNSRNMMTLSSSFTF